MYRITHMHIALALALTPRFRPGTSPLRARVRLFLLAGGRFQLGTIIVLAAIGVPPHFGGGWYLNTRVGVDAPTLAPLSVAGHVALLKVVLSCLVTVGEPQVIKIFQRSLVVMERHSGDVLQNSVQLLLTLALHIVIPL